MAGSFTMGNGTDDLVNAAVRENVRYSPLNKCA